MTIQKEPPEERAHVLAAIRLLDKRGGKLVRQVLEAYEKARKDLLERLLRGNDTALTAMHNRQILRQVESRLGELYHEVSERFGVVLGETARLESEQAVAELRHLWGELPLKPGPLPLLEPIIPHQMVEQLVENAGQHIKAVNEDLKSRISRELTQAMIRGDSTHAAAKGILEQGLTLEGLAPRRVTKAGVAVPVFPSIQARAEAIARTELSNAANMTHLATYQEAKKQLPGLRVRWSSALCARTCDHCRALHGQTVEPGEAFPGGETAPPAHPNCLCRLVAEIVDVPLADHLGGFPMPQLDLFIDGFEPELEVIEDDADSGDRPMRLRVLLTKANTRNGNRRIYPRKVLEDMVARGQERLKTHSLTMEWEHPPEKRDERGRILGFATDPRRAVSIIDALYMRGDKVYVDTTLLDTDMGRAIKAQVKAKKRPPVSLRALGRADQRMVNGEPTAIATFLDWFGGDWVDNPALLEAGPEEVLTDSQIEAALESAGKELDMNELEQLKAQLAALTDAQSADKAEIEALKKRIAALTDEQVEDPADDDPKQKAAKSKAKAEGKDENAEADAVKDSIATLTAELKAVKDSIAEADAAKRKLGAQAEVKAFADAVEAREEVKRFSPDMRKEIVARVSRAETKDGAEQALTDAIADMDRAISAAQLAARGFTPDAASGSTQGRTTIEVKDNQKPWMAVIDKLDEAYRDHARLSNSPVADPTLRAANQPFIDQLITQVASREGQALTDSAQRILDGQALMTDSTSTSNLWNQPTLLLALIVQQFANLEALQFVQGIGPDGFTQADQGQGRIGSVLRMPVEYFSAPAGAENLPYFDGGMLSSESAAIPEIALSTTWLSFLPNWRRAAFTLTAEAEAAMANGPLNYQAWARLTYHLTQYKARVIDRSLYEEMLQTSTEFGAKPITNEAGNAAQWTYAAGGSAGGYGSQVVGVLQLLCGGTTASPNTGVPVVKPRATADLNAAGQLAAGATRNPFSIANVGSTVQVMGYLDGSGNIAQIPGQAAPTFAVDWINGKVVFNAASGVGASTIPTIGAYSYETNFDTFSLAVPNGVEAAVYYNRLLAQLDDTAALMGSHPRYMPPDLAIMSLTVANKIQNAQTFYQWVSPVGSLLKNPKITTSNKFAERNGIEMAKINQPWSAGDRRILTLKQGSTKYGIDKPFEIQGPYPSYDPATGNLKDEKKAYGRENSVICTPQATDQSGKVLNPVSRTIILK